MRQLPKSADFELAIPCATNCIGRVEWPPKVVELLQRSACQFGLGDGSSPPPIFGGQTNSFHSTLLHSHLAGQPISQPLAGLVPKWRTNLPPWLLTSQPLQALIMHQRTPSSALPTAAHYAGSLNLFAHPGCARLIYSSILMLKTPSQSQSDTQFLTSFNYVFPLSDFPQILSWQLVTLVSEMSRFLILMLCGQNLSMPQWIVQLKSPIVTTSLLGACTSTSTPPSLELTRVQHAYMLKAFLATGVHAGALGDGKQIGYQSVATGLR